MLHSYMSVVCIGVFKKVFFNTRQPPGWKSRRPQNDVYLAFLPSAIIYSSSTLPDYMMSLTLYIPHAYSPYCVLYISLCAGKENLFNNQEVLQLIIISFILMTLMCDSGVILKGEIRCQSLSGIKVLLTVHIFMYMLLTFVGNNS